VTDEGAIPAPDGEHLLSDDKTVIVTEGGKITEIKEKEVEAMKDEKPSEVEAALLMLAEGLQAIKTELAEMKAAQTAPTPQAKRVPTAVAQKVTPKADAAPNKDKKPSGFDLLANAIFKN